jgi:RHS repeat-associated protein
MSLPQGFLIYVFFDEFLNINSQYSGMIQVSEPGSLEMLQSQAISIPSNGYFYTYLTNYSDNLVSFDNLTIRRKNGVVRAVKEYYPYGLEYGRFNGSYAYNAIEMYNKGYSSATWHELEWKYEGLDLNYFAARYYDPILGRWHAPDPLEQCHSPYTGMVNDPANFVDPDGRLATPLVTLASSGSFYLSTANSLVSTGMSIMGGVMSFVSTCAGIVAGVRGFITTADLVKGGFDFVNGSAEFSKVAGSNIYTQNDPLRWIGGSTNNKIGRGDDFLSSTSAVPKNLDVSEESKWTDEKLLAELLDALEDGTFGVVEYDARRVVDHLKQRTGEDFFWGAEVTRTARTIPEGRRLELDIRTQFVDQMKLHKGDVTKLNMVVKKPNYKANESIDLKTLIGGTQQVDIWLEDIQFTGDSYTARIKYRIMDTFGVSEMDALNPSFAAGFAREGLRCLWILQHQRGYKPFRTSLTVNMNIHGKL